MIRMMHFTTLKDRDTQAMSCISNPEEEGQAVGLLVKLPDRCLASLIRRSLRDEVGRWTSFGRSALAAVVSAESVTAGIVVAAIGGAQDKSGQATPP
jgi:hypothetical protein